MSRRNLCQPSFVDAMVSGWGKSGGFLDRIEQAFDWAAFEALAFADRHLRRRAPGLSASGSVQDPSLQPCHTLSDPGAEEAIRGPLVVSPCLMACPLRPRRRTTLRSGAFWPDNRKARLGLHLHSGGLQPGAAAQTAGDAGMSAPAPTNCKLIGRWRIVGGRHLGSRLSRPLRAGDDHDHRPRSWRKHLRRSPGRPRHRIQPLIDRVYVEGFDEMDEVSGHGSAKRATTARSRSNSPITTAKPSSKRNGRLLQQPASSTESRFS
jgi:hypothetical protein